MKFRISSVADAGNLEKERIVLVATADGDIGRYAIFRGIATDTGIKSGNIENTYWFMDKDVKEDDFVVLYSKAGDRSEKKNESGNKSHFFYWGRQSPLWTSGWRPVLVNTIDLSFGIEPQARRLCGQNPQQRQCPRTNSGRPKRTRT